MWIYEINESTLYFVLPIGGRFSVDIFFLPYTYIDYSNIQIAGFTKYTQ